ncbi:MAG: DUF1987 domain-containing protein [Bacteroidales bacterium]|jgi:hypothetical protein|nr:DUF1987 domain-containing protein [Bacteroidales bacterium]
MIDRYEIQETEETPGIILDKSEGIFEFSGKSLPEDANEFFSGIMNWFREYSNDPNRETIISFKMEYFNSSTARKFVEIFIILEDQTSKGNPVKVKWHFLKNDKMMEERGREFSAVVDIPFEFVEY